MNNHTIPINALEGFHNHILKIGILILSLYRVAQKECSTFDQSFQENKGQNEKIVCVIAYEIHFSSNMTPRSLILMKAFWFYGRFLRSVIFKICSSISKVTIYVAKFAIVWLPRVKCLHAHVLKMTLPRKNGSRIKTPSSRLTILVSSCWKKNFIHNNAHNFLLFCPSFSWNYWS